MADSTDDLADVPRVANIPTPQLLSFVTHDIYGPASMLRTYLQAVADSTDDPELREMIADAGRLSGQVEGMLRFLRICLGLAGGSLELETRPLRLLPFLEEFLKANPAVERLDRAQIDEATRIVVDERLLATSLEGAAWQMGRMGSRQGPVALGILGMAEGRVEVGLWRTDGELEGAVLVRAMQARDEDWTPFLRRLPACGFPLRIGQRVVESMGGKVETRSEGTLLVLALPLRSPAG